MVGRVPRLAPALGPKAWEKTDELGRSRNGKCCHYRSTTRIWEAARVPAPHPDTDPELFWSLPAPGCLGVTWGWCRSFKTCGEIL